MNIFFALFLLCQVIAIPVIGRVSRYGSYASKHTYFKSSKFHIRLGSLKLKLREGRLHFKDAPQAMSIVRFRESQCVHFKTWQSFETEVRDTWVIFEATSSSFNLSTAQALLCDPALIGAISFTMEPSIYTLTDTFCQASYFTKTFLTGLTLLFFYILLFEYFLAFFAWSKSGK